MNKILQLIFLTITSLNAYPEMQDIPPEVLEKMPEQMREKMGMEEESTDYETIQDFLDDGDYETSEGFLKLYKNTEDDEYFLELREDDLNKEFIYFAYSMNAPQAAGIPESAAPDHRSNVAYMHSEPPRMESAPPPQPCPPNSCHSNHST